MEIHKDNLDQALPLLMKAQSALNSLDKTSIAELKSLSNPSNLIKLVMQCVCILLKKDVFIILSS